MWSRTHSLTLISLLSRSSLVNSSGSGGSGCLQHNTPAQCNTFITHNSPSLPHSLPSSLSPLPHSLPSSLSPLLTPSHPHSLPSSLFHSFTPLLTHTLTHSQTHSPQVIDKLVQDLPQSALDSIYVVALHCHLFLHLLHTCFLCESRNYFIL